MPAALPQLSPFGQQLRMWRRQRGMSQLALALEASTTSRHVSFIETGRSRPGRPLVMRIATALGLAARDRNALLVAAGLAPAFPECAIDDARLKPFRRAVEAVLERHHPYPGCAFDPVGRVVLANDAFRAFSPGFENLSPEESLDAFFAPGSPMHDQIENWRELAWGWVDRTRQALSLAQNPHLEALLSRALQHLEGVPRPPLEAGADLAVMCPRLRVGDRIIETFATVMRFEGVREVTLSELRVELIFPVDDAGDAFFRSLSKT